MSPVNLRIPVVEPSQAGEARRAAIAAAIELRFSATQQGRAGIVATELASNLAKHASQGEFVVQEVRCGGYAALELFAIDKGPGLDMAKCQIDGYSTAGSPGTGLGAVVRLSETFDLYSQPGAGTVFVSRIPARDGARPRRRFDYGAVSTPYPGETLNGDAWCVHENEDRLSVMMVDGLGHGEFAAEAARTALELFQRYPEDTPANFIDRAHGALRSTRGAAMAVASIDPDRHQVKYAGVGNLVGAVVSDEGARRMISHDGTVGATIYKVQELTYPWPLGSLLILHTDGLSGSWHLEKYPGLLARHPSVIAGVLYRDWKRKSDDATVLVVREFQ